MPVQKLYPVKCEHLLSLYPDKIISWSFDGLLVGDKSPSLDEPGYHRVTLILTPGHDRPVIGGRQGRPFRANKEERR